MMITHQRWSHPFHRSLLIQQRAYPAQPRSRPAHPVHPAVPGATCSPLKHAACSASKFRHRLAAKTDAGDSAAPAAPKKRGRKPGGKNKKKAAEPAAADVVVEAEAVAAAPPAEPPADVVPAVAPAADAPEPASTPLPSIERPAAAASSTASPSLETPALAGPTPSPPPPAPASDPQPPPSTSRDDDSPSTPSPVDAPASTSVVPVTADPTRLAVSKQGYQSFEMDGVELLIAETSDGRLKLKDCYVFDAGSDVYAEPDMVGDIPDTHLTYQCIPWTEEYVGDVFANIEPWTKIQKMVFIPVLSEEPYELKLDDVYIFSAHTRRLTKVEVERAGPYIVDPVLRIREDKVTIEDSSYMPTFMEVQAAAEVNRPPEPSLDASWLKELQEEVAEYKALPADVL